MKYGNTRAVFIYPKAELKIATDFAVFSAIAKASSFVLYVEWTNILLFRYDVRYVCKKRTKKDQTHWQCGEMKSVLKYIDTLNYVCYFYLWSLIFHKVKSRFGYSAVGSRYVHIFHKLSLLRCNICNHNINGVGTCNSFIQADICVYVFLSSHKALGMISGNLFLLCRIIPDKHLDLSSMSSLSN